MRCCSAGLALVLGGLAASNVAGREAALERRVGGLVDVVVAREPIAAGTPVRARALAVRRVPARFAPLERVSAPRELIGQKATVDIAAGTDMARRLVGDGIPRPPGPPVRRGERVAEVVALGSADVIVPGSRVDVLVTPEPQPDSGGEAVLVLEDVLVLDAVAVAPESAPARGATLRPARAWQRRCGSRCARPSTSRRRRTSRANCGCWRAPTAIACAGGPGCGWARCPERPMQGPADEAVGCASVDGVFAAHAAA